jgi:hypothetical protein
MFCDYMSEEIKKTNRISTENAYKMFKSNQTLKNQLFDPSKEFNLVLDESNYFNLLNKNIFNL